MSGRDTNIEKTTNARATIEANVKNVNNKISGEVNKAVTNVQTQATNALKGINIKGVLDGALGALATNVMGKLMSKLSQVPALGILTKAAGVAILVSQIANIIKIQSSTFELLKQQTKSGKVTKDSSINTLQKKEEEVLKNYSGLTGNSNATSATYDPDKYYTQAANLASGSTQNSSDSSKTVIKQVTSKSNRYVDPRG